MMNKKRPSLNVLSAFLEDPYHELLKHLAVKLCQRQDSLQGHHQELVQTLTCFFFSRPALIHEFVTLCLDLRLEPHQEWILIQALKATRFIECEQALVTLALSAPNKELTLQRVLVALEESHCQVSGARAMLRSVIGIKTLCLGLRLRARRVLEKYQLENSKDIESLSAAYAA